MEAKEITTRTGRFRLEESGILRATVLPRSEQTLADAQESIRVIAGLTGGKGAPCLIDMRGVKSVDQGARAYYTGPEAARVQRALAMLVSSPVSRVLGNFFIAVSPPSVPTRMFTVEEESIDWLKGFLDLARRWTRRTRASPSSAPSSSACRRATSRSAGRRPIAEMPSTRPSPGSTRSRAISPPSAPSTSRWRRGSTRSWR